MLEMVLPWTCSWHPSWYRLRWWQDWSLLRYPQPQMPCTERVRPMSYCAVSDEVEGFCQCRRTSSTCSRWRECRPLESVLDSHVPNRHVVEDIHHGESVHGPVSLVLKANLLWSVRFAGCCWDGWCWNSTRLCSSPRRSEFTAILSRLDPQTSNS